MNLIENSKNKLSSFKKKLQVSTKRRSTAKSAPPTHHYLQKQSSKIFNNSPKIELDIEPRPINLKNSSHVFNQNVNRQDLPFSNLVRIWKEATNLKNSDEITVNGVSGIWLNKQECLNWKGPIPLEQYKVNQDPNPIMMRKQRQETEHSTQRLSVRLLKPPPLPDAGDLIIKEDETYTFPPAPPIIIRQQLESGIKSTITNQAPKIIREKPPKMPDPVPTQIITIPGKVLEPPERQIIIERVPMKNQVQPQDIIIERWLSYPRQKRNIVFQSNNNKNSIPYYKTPQNIIIDWEIANDNKNINFLDTETIDPNEYTQTHLNELIESEQLSELISNFGIPQQEVLVSNNTNVSNNIILTGDVQALQLIDKNKDDLNTYLHAKF